MINEVVHAQETGDGFLTMWPNGDVSLAATQAEALSDIKRRARRAAKRGVTVVTRIEWTFLAVPS